MASNLKNDKATPITLKFGKGNSAGKKDPAEIKQIKLPSYTSIRFENNLESNKKSDKVDVLESNKKSDKVDVLESTKKSDKVDVLESTKKSDKVDVQSVGDKKMAIQSSLKEIEAKLKEFDSKFKDPKKQKDAGMKQEDKSKTGEKMVDQNVNKVITAE